MVWSYQKIETEQGDFVELLERMELFEIFQPLLKFYSEMSVFRSLVKYIVYCYTADSPKLAKGGEWLRMKKKIFKSLELPENEMDNVVLHQNPGILSAIKNWLDFQNEEYLSTYCMLSDLIVEMRTAAVSSLTDGTGIPDYERKRKCAESVISLQQLKTEVENKLIQSNPALKDIPEMKMLAKKKNVMGPESYSPNGVAVRATPE